MTMRRGGGCGYGNQTAVMHNSHNPHGPPQHQHPNHRIGIGPNRMYHHQSQSPQLVPYGHVNSPRPLSFPSPPLPSSAISSLTPQLHQQQQHYSGPGLIGGGIPQSLMGVGNGPLVNSNSNYSSSISGPSVPSSAVVGGDMPPVETVVARLETACRLLHGIGGNNTRVNEIGVEIQILSEDLRRVGPLLETAYPDVLDRVMSSMRDASAQPSLPPSLRLAIFELVELRASKWLLPSDSSNYYRQRRNINDSVDMTQDGQGPGMHHYNNSGGTGRPIVIGPTKPEVIFQSSSPSMGTSPIPSNSTNSETSNSAKTFREEVVIKNSDSGKVMGVRGRRVHIIEAISDTIISFEKVAPTAKERVLSINGYSQQSISMAKQLIQETIQRNSSPVFDGLVTSTGSEYSGEGDDLDTNLVAGALKKLQTPSKSEDASRFGYSVTLGVDIIKISGSNLQFVQEAKFALDDHFSQKYPELFYSSNNVEDEEEIVEEIQLVPKYDRTTLLSLSLIKTQVPDFNHLEPDLRSSIILEKPKSFDPEKFCREMATGITKQVSQESVGG